MHTKNNLYTIGQISQLTGISCRMLRYYEKKGILMPSKRNNENNYRYYSEKQLEELLLIKELRRVDFTVENLINIFRNRDLSSLRQELENRIQAANKDMFNSIRKYVHMNELYLRILRSLSALEIQKAVLTMPIIKKVEIQTQKVVFIRYHGCFNSRQIFMEKIAELYHIINQYNLITLGPLFVIFHEQYLTSFRMVTGDVEICVPLESINPECPHIKVLERFQAISYLQVGPYNQLEDTYNSLEQWAQKHNLKLSGSSVEEYVVNPMMTSEDINYVTQIYLPLAK